MQLLQSFISNNKIKSVTDVGCGDWQFSQHMYWSGITYNGFDVVESIVKDNQSKFGSKNTNFHTLSAISDLPKADLVVCKDVLQHLPNAEVVAYLNFFYENYKYAIITNDIRMVHISDEHEIALGPESINHDVPHGGYRLIRPDLSPFNFNVAVLLRWSIDDPKIRWTKDACLLLSRVTTHEPRADQVHATGERYRAELEALSAQVRAAEEKAERYRAEADAFQASTSWRITGPLRGIRRLLR
jgi:SAM-dependent methyltransferase